MGTKIKIYETEIKRAVRRKLMERFVDESEEMTVYDQDEFNSSFDKLEKGSYGVKDTQGKIRSVTVNEDDEELQMQFLSFRFNRHRSYLGGKTNQSN